MLRDGPTSDGPRFRFRLVGPFALERDGEALPDRAVGSRKGRTLLKLLLVERGHLVSTDRIVDALWGDAPPGKPEENVAALVSRLRAVVGSEAITGGRGGYRVPPGAGHVVDVDEAEELTREAEARLRAGEPSLAGVAAEGALRILDAGALLEDEPYAPWCDEARGELERVHRRARRAAWDAALQLSEHGWAAQVAGAAIGADPLDEEAYRAVMTAHRQAGEPGAALAAYERLRGALADGLGVDPSPETESLYLSILRAEPVPDVPQRARSAPAGERSPDPGFVGRERELAWLSERWAESATGKPALVLICGEAGIGKTSLAGEVNRLATRTGGTAVLTRCYEAERSLFLQPIVEAIRSIVIALPPDDVRRLAGPWAGTLAELVPEVARVLRPHGYQPSSPEIERRRSFDALSAFLRHLARERPLLLILDDLHNAGTSTVEALHFLFRRSNVDRLLVLATVRTDEGAEAVASLGGVAERLDLGPLSDRDVARLAERMGAGELAGRIQAMTRGHPLFVVESLRLVAEGGGGLAPATRSTSSCGERRPSARRSS